MCDRFVEVFGAEAVYRDSMSVPPGVDFTVHIGRAIANAVVVLVVVGPSWVDASEGGRRRLDDPADHVRLEIEAALKIPNLVVIPVFVRDMKMPRADELPKTLQPMTLRNGISVRPNPHFANDFSQLLAEIQKAIEADAAQKAERAARLQKAAADLAQAMEGRPVTMLDENEWSTVMTELAAGRVAAVLGPELGTTDVQGVVASAPHHLARAVAEALELPPPLVDTDRPLGQVARQFARTGGRDDTFARALVRASDSFDPGPIQALVELAKVNALRLVITTSVDNSVEAAFHAVRHGAVRSLVLAPHLPSSEFTAARPDEETLLVHIAGRIHVIPDTAITDSDWLPWSLALQAHTRGFNEVVDNLRSCSLLFIGGGHPLGFVQWFIQVCRGRRLLFHDAKPVWIGASVLQGDQALIDWLQGTRTHARLFDDQGGQGFVFDLADRWVRRSLVPAPEPQLPPAARSTPENKPSESPFAAAATGGPWPGLAAYSADMRPSFRGRNREIVEILRAVQTEPLTVLFAATGVGKTSLLRAGLIPALWDRGFLPIYLHLQHGPQAPTLVEQVESSITATLAEGGIDAGQVSPDSTLWGFFHRRSRIYVDRRSQRLMPVLIVDRFEELFSMNAAPETAARPPQVLAEIADLAENRPTAAFAATIRANPTLLDDYDVDAAFVRILLSVREDYLPDIQGLAADLPTIMSNSIRLLPFSREQALDVVLQTSPGLVTTDAARRIVDAVSRNDRVEPPILQVVLHSLDQERRARGIDRIDASLLDSHSPDAVLDRYVADALADMPPQVGRFIERELITAAGFRDSVSLDQAARELAEIGGGRNEIDMLVQRRLLKVDSHRGTYRIELTHDALVKPITRRRRS